MRWLLTILAPLALGACSEHHVDTVAEWCEHISGVDLKEKYQSSWAIAFAINFDGDAIRDEFVKTLDEKHLAEVENLAPRMAWREGTALHLTNPSNFLAIETRAFINQWRDDIGRSVRYEHENPDDACFYGTVQSMFDSLHIHSKEADSSGSNGIDKVTVIDTGRRQRLELDPL